MPRLPVLPELHRLVGATARVPGRVVALLDEADDLLAHARLSLADLDSIAKAARLSIERTDALLDDTERTTARIDGVLDSTERTTTRIDAVLDNTERTSTRIDAVLDDTAHTTARVEELLTDAGRATATATALTDQLAPTIRAAAPLAERFVSGFSAAEVDAAIKLVDELPELSRSVRENVIPILTTLGNVGPDIRALLEVTDDLKHAILGIPGFTFFKKRGTEIEEDAQT